jgi:hypothetical protein
VEDAVILDPAPLPDEALMQRQAIDAVEAALHTLRPREERVLRLRFGMGCEEHTLSRIAALLGYKNGERVRQIEARALRTLRHPSRSRRLRRAAEGVGWPPPPPEPTYVRPPHPETRQYSRYVAPEVDPQAQERHDKWLRELFNYPVPPVEFTGGRDKVSTMRALVLYHQMHTKVIMGAEPSPEELREAERVISEFTLEKEKDA